MYNVAALEISQCVADNSNHVDELTDSKEALVRLTKHGDEIALHELCSHV